MACERLIEGWGERFDALVAELESFSGADRKFLQGALAGMSDASWAAMFDQLVGGLGELPLPQVQARCTLGKAKLEAVEMRRLAAEVTADGDDTRARRQAKAGGARSRSSARRAAARAKAVAANTSLADELACGDLSEEKLDAIADAMSADASAATDQRYLNRVRRGSADDAKRATKDRKTKRKDGEAEAERQRRLRTASTYVDRAAGLDVFTLAGDQSTISELWRAVRWREKQLREADGGRDLPESLRPRTYDQRMFDAAVELILGTGIGPSVSRPSAVLAIGVDGSVEAVGDGPIDDERAFEILRRAGVHAAIVDNLTGQPLWWGRSRRNASDAQFLALVIRDKGCVLCDADWVGCEAHHQIPWTSVDKGETNIDELVLLCVDCHHTLHAQRLTIERLGDGTWKTRPATPGELPATDRQSAPRRDPSDRSRERDGNSPAPALANQPTHRTSPARPRWRPAPNRPTDTATRDGDGDPD